MQPRTSFPTPIAVAAEEIQSEHKFTVVLTKGDKFMRRLCMNCADPACASVCPVGALRKTAAGPVIYEESRCMGCRYCMVACPFSVPKYEWNKLLPRVQKCTMCPDRVQAGNPTACAEICPTGATKFGERDELIAEAQQRIRDNPGQIRRAHLRRERSGRHLGAAAVERALRRVWLSHRSHSRPAADVHLPGAVADSRLRSARRNGIGGHLVDHAPA